MLIQPAAFYQERLAAKLGELVLIRNAIKRLESFRLISGILIIVAIVFLFRDQLPGDWWSLGGIFAIFLVLVRKHSREQHREEEAQLIVSIYQNELAALNGDTTPFRSGSEYADTQHPYSYDLDFFGDRSVYQMLCRAATEDGAEQLATLLREPNADGDAIIQRQHIIRELSLKPDFNTGFRIAGARYQEARADTKRINAWLQMGDNFINKRLLRSAAVVIPVVTIALGLLGILGFGVLAWFSLLALVNWILLGVHAKKIKEAAYYVARSAKLIGKYEALLAAVSSESFETTEWQEKARTAHNAIRRFKKLAALFESRYNGMVGPLMNTLFLFDIQCCLRLEHWRKEHHGTVAEGLILVTLVDQYVSLATYAFNFPGYTYPEIVAAGAYESERMVHPLLQEQAVGNDFSLGRNERFYLLTGANMTGKSTFIRTLGVNLILGYCGLPLRAGKTTLPLLRLVTAMRITDSVQDDISYFKAELNRVSGIMQSVAAAGGRYLVLLDEPLRGTNTTDKQNGTRSIIEKLLKHQAMGIVATHDTVLCSLEHDHDHKVANYHFESSVQGNELKFDYRLKAGCSTSNNATILMMQLGIID